MDKHTRKCVLLFSHTLFTFVPHVFVSVLLILETAGVPLMTDFTRLTSGQTTLDVVESGSTNNLSEGITGGKNCKKKKKRRHRWVSTAKQMSGPVSCWRLNHLSNKFIDSQVSFSTERSLHRISWKNWKRPSKMPTILMSMRGRCSHSRLISLKTEYRWAC